MRWLLPLVVVVLAVLAFRLESGAVVTEPVVSVDTDPTGNTATFVGTIDPCRQVTVGPPAFEVDVTIQQVTNLAGFEADLSYNAAVLKVTGVDYNYFLATAGFVTNWGEAPSPQQPDTDGSLDMVAALFPLPDAGASGEGAMARVTLQAVANGLSDLSLSNVKLSDINVQPIGDENGDDFFDGPVANGDIAVGQPCSTPTPDPPSVGGFAELPDAAAQARGSGPGAGHRALLAGLASAAAAAIAAWYVWARRPGAGRAPGDRRR